MTDGQQPPKRKRKPWKKPSVANGRPSRATKGFKVHAPTAASRATVEALKSYGVQHDLIAKEIGMERESLERHYRFELQYGAERAIKTVEENLFNLTKTKVGAVVFYLINRAPDRWKDRKFLEGNINVGNAPPPDFTNLSPEERDVLREATAIIRKAQERPKLIDVTPGKDPDDED